MIHLRTPSVSARLMRNSIVVTGAALLIALVAVTVTDYVSATNAARTALDVRAKMVAAGVTAALSFDSPDDAHEVLDTLSADPTILAATVWSTNNTNFAAYDRAGIATPRSVLACSQSVELDGSILGRVDLTCDMTPLYDQMLLRVGVAAVVLVLTMLLAALLSRRLQRSISDPIHHLVGTAQKVAEDENYGLRARRYADDEIGVLTDAFNRMLSEIQTHHRALQRSHEELEERVRVRTADLEHARITAEAANQAKSDFLANMSHEIRTPMTAILGYTDVLMDEASDIERLHDCVATIRRNGKHLLALINEILDISKIEAGQMTVERLQCSPIDILNDVYELMRERAEDKGLRLETSVEGEIPAQIWSDPTRLKQILVNLVGNSIKFTELGGIRVVAKYLPGAEPLIEFGVIDTGIGIADEAQKRLFKPFTQADNSMTRKFGGTGLGLTISRRFAELLGGDLTLDSELGVGTTFRATISTGDTSTVELVRVADQVARRPGRDGAEAEADTEAKKDDSKETLELRVLLAEDGPDNQRLISYFLRKAGATVEIAENGQCAVDALQHAEVAGEPFDVVFMDMQMPVLDGYRATQKLRELGFDLPIIALTAHAMSGDRDKCISAGCDDYTTKPVNRKKLIALAREWSRKRHVDPTT